jgi:lipopolysaccharide biosynthesis protein
MSLVRKMVSIGYWLLDGEKSIADFRKKAVWYEKDLIVENPTEKLLTPLVITAHVFYPEFTTQLIEHLKQLPRETKVLVTTCSQEIKRELEDYLALAGNPHDVRLTPNVGRNFGPLLVEFSKQLLNEESFIHVHSKKSLHSPRIAKEWLKRNIDLLLTRGGIQRISSVIEANPNIGLVFVDASDLLWGINFRWGRSNKLAKKTFAHIVGIENVKWRGRLSFPAGGMFWVLTDAIRPILEIDWNYKMFPKEENQRDGTTHHVLERLIGEVVPTQSKARASLIGEISRFRLIDSNTVTQKPAGKQD